MSTAKSLLLEQQKLDGEKKNSIEKWEKAIKSVLDPDCIICHSSFSNVKKFSHIFIGREDQHLQDLENLAEIAKNKPEIIQLTEGIKKIEVIQREEKAIIRFRYKNNCVTIPLKDLFDYILKNS